MLQKLTPLGGDLLIAIVRTQPIAKPCKGDLFCSGGPEVTLTGFNGIRGDAGAINRVTLPGLKDLSRVA